MKQTLILLLMVAAVLGSCSEDEDATPAAKLNHIGERWRIASVEYNIVDQSLNPTQWVQIGTAENAGYFYFTDNDGSFNILINNKRQEDYFGYTLDGTSMTIVQIDQSISTTRFSQNIIAMTGDDAGTTMTLQGTFTKQGTVYQYIFTGTFQLVKE